MILYIDTTDFNKVTFVINDSRKFVKRSFKINPHQSRKILSKLEEFLRSYKLQVTSIKKIVVNKGPGSFTGIRVSAAHALALGFALGVLVKFVPKDKFNKKAHYKPYA